MEIVTGRAPPSMRRAWLARATRSGFFFLQLSSTFFRFLQLSLTFFLLRTHRLQSTVEQGLVQGEPPNFLTCLDEGGVSPNQIASYQIQASSSQCARAERRGKNVK